MAFEGFPLIVGWELTLACNLRCRHCASSAGAPRDNELTIAECLAICDQFPELLVQEVDFTGGEALLKSGWEKIAKRLRDLRIQTRMITNGANLSPDTVALMKDSGLNTVAVSLDGLEATHDYVRGIDGMFGRVVSGLERLAAAGLRPAVITAVNGLSVSELDRMFDLLRSIGVRVWQVQHILPNGRGLDSEELHLTEEQYFELGRFALETAQQTSGTDFDMRTADSCGYYFTDLLYETEWQGCNAGIAGVGIMSDGRIKGCLSMPDDLVEGDLRQSNLWDIWFRPGAFSYTRDWNIGLLGPNCAGCEHGEQCHGGCTSMSYAITGITRNDPYCFHGIRRRQAIGVRTKLRREGLVQIPC
jgi:radical SAM protein with 4Fe4S-binding SPASM domain